MCLLILCGDAAAQLFLHTDETPGYISDQPTAQVILGPQISLVDTLASSDAVHWVGFVLQGDLPTRSSILGFCTSSTDTLPQKLAPYCFVVNQLNNSPMRQRMLLTDPSRPGCGRLDGRDIVP